MNTTTQQRPKWNDEMRNELAQIVGKQVYDWCNGETDLEDCINDVFKALRWGYNSNGYELAKELDDMGYTPDSELVELLDGVWSDAHTIETKHVENWVKGNSIELSIPIGTIVDTNRGTGEVVEIYSKTAKYGVCIPSQGQEKGKSHSIILFENVTISEQDAQVSDTTKVQ